ncbi:MAG: ubiquinol-cytochrome C chaperone [Bradyrhizobiaceae bacterium]|nr:ubiquinol-cytochrome C chaperone [Bradyrhizobiaceae bacterium]
MFAALRRRRERQATIDRLYGAIVAQARLPEFYSGLHVPDTLEGRFDLLVLHVYFVFRRLAGDAEARAVGQAVFDRFVEDMDDSLREMGTGDLAVPKRMRAMGEAFYGRAEAYDLALRDADDARLAGALLRNVYAGEESAAPAARKLARYVRQVEETLAGGDVSLFARGLISFPAPEFEE